MKKEEEVKTIKSENILVCNKGNMILNEFFIPDTQQKAYNLKFDFKKLDHLDNVDQHKFLLFHNHLLIYKTILVFLDIFLIIF